jgi:large repetitive protein
MTAPRAWSPFASSPRLFAVLVALTVAGGSCGANKREDERDGGGAGGGGRAGGGGATASCGEAGGVGGAADGQATGGAGGEAGAGGGRQSCAGNAISLGANGTGAAATDAAHARVMVDLKDDLPIGEAARTVELWAYIRSTDWLGEANTLFEYGTEATTGSAFGLNFGGASRSIRPYISGDNDNANQVVCLNTTVDQWVHFAMTWDGMAVRIYVNGVVRSSRTNPAGQTLATARTFLTIGCSNPRFSCFGGTIDEFRVWKVARSAAEIAASYDKNLVGNETGLVGYWKFNEAPGALAVADSVTTAGHVPHPGTPTAVMPTQTPAFVTPNPPAPILCP